MKCTIEFAFTIGDAVTIIGVPDNVVNNIVIGLYADKNMRRVQVRRVFHDGKIVEAWWDEDEVKASIAGPDSGGMTP